MPNRTSLALALAIMAVSGWGVFSALDWPWKAKLFPLVIGIPLFCLAAAEALWAIFSKQAAAPAASRLTRPGRARRRSAGAVPVAADPRSHSPAARRRQRHGGARHRAAAGRAAGAADHRGEPPRRQRQSRDGSGGEGGAGRLHA